MYPTVFWGNLLRELRENHYMLQKEVATLLHISRQSYSNIEVGKTKPTPEQLATLSYVYEVNLLDYVDKCLPASYLAERYAFRADQTRKIAELLLIQEEMEKFGTSKPKENSPQETESTEQETESSPESLNGSASFPIDDTEKTSEGTRKEKPIPKPRKRRMRKLAEDNASALKKELLRRRNTRKKAPQFHNTSGMSDVALLKSKRHIEDVLARGEFYGTESPEGLPPEDSALDPQGTSHDKKRSSRKGRTAKQSTKKRPSGKTRAAGKASNPTPGKSGASGNHGKK